MKAMATDLPGVMLMEPEVFVDARGFFSESYHQAKFDAALGQAWTFVQDNHSRSRKGSLRGLHYQLPPHAQGKLVRVVRGAVWDVAVDLRRESAFFGRWTAALLSEDNQLQMWIPPGFAHGFYVLSEQADTLYKTTAAYAPQSECSLAWDDPDLSIDWPTQGVEPLLSPRDQSAPRLREAVVFEAW